MSGFIQSLKLKIKRKLGVPDVEYGLIKLHQSGFKPKEIFDIGAHRGEFAKTCREIFNPKPTVYCVEPLSSCREKLQSLEAKNEIVYLPGLVGAQNIDKVPFNEMDTASSVLEDQTSKPENVNYYPMSTLDTLVETKKLKVPELLKIDTQGYELDVLRGYENGLKQTRVILAEVNFLDIYKNVPLAHTVFQWLGERDFVLFDICSLIRRPLDKALWQADVIFVKSNDPLRNDKRWK